ncbi:MAG TPA: nitrous oxide reductase accessory protein NosL [Labilithrix sp.]|nr:nitrous oxide reductase accessory protein NosL [Labilithrix sp.]
MLRRDFIRLVAATLVVPACKGKPGEQRCKHCGMRIDPASPWRADLVGADGVTTTSFDTPRCALSSWRSGKSTAASLRVQEYYERRWRSAEELRFVIGGDVPGPMGPDLVPVDPARATKFIQDHGADRAVRLDEITMDVLGAIK